MRRVRDASTYITNPGKPSPSLSASSSPPTKEGSPRRINTRLKPWQLEASSHYLCPQKRVRDTSHASLKPQQALPPPSLLQPGHHDVEDERARRCVLMRLEPSYNYKWRGRGQDMSPSPSCQSFSSFSTLLTTIYRFFFSSNYRIDDDDDETWEAKQTRNRAPRYIFRNYNGKGGRIMMLRPGPPSRNYNTVKLQLVGIIMPVKDNVHIRNYNARGGEREL